MDAMVHFTVGLTCGLLVLLLVDWHPRWEFLAMFASGVWALLPDGHWMFHEAGLDEPAAAWKSVHDTSSLTDAFWFHGVLDRSETGHPKVEMGVSLAVLLFVVAFYAAANDWQVG